MNNRSAEWTAARWYGLALVSVAAALGIRLGLFYTNTSERKRTEKRLRLLESVSLQTSDGVLIVKVTGGNTACQEPVFVNPAFQRMTGAGLDDLRNGIPLPIPDQMPAAGTGVRFERRIVRTDGAVFRAELRGEAIADKNGEYTHNVWTFRDITGQKQSQAASLVSATSQMVGSTSAPNENTSAEDEVHRLNAELEAFAYSVSHDLRAPLRAIDGFSRIVLEEYAAQLPEGARHYLEIARRNALQMGELIDGLLAFSRLGRQQVRKQRLAPSDLVRQAWEDISVDWQGRTVEMVVGDLPPCEADPLLLQQIFVNLLSNALKFTRTRAVARIEIASPPVEEWDALPPQLTADKTALVYMVRDNGVGFDMRYAERLFGVFQRLHRAEEYAGAGIGLANVKRLVHKHGGEVWASGELDRGAIFYFTLPGIRAPEQRPAARQQEQLQS